MRRLLLPLTLTAALLAPLLFAGSASAATRTYVLKSPTFKLDGFATELPKIHVKTPRKTGYVVGFNARLVYRNGRQVPVKRVMLHHIVFLNLNPSRKSSCAGRRSEPFWGTGEEHQRLILPKGYGYPVHASDPWRMQLMLMSHGVRTQHVRVEYRVTMVTGQRLQPVKPLWLRANGCTKHPSYDVNGEGGEHVKSADWRLPVSGRIVAAGAHLHGASRGMTVSQPGCDDRTLIKHEALYGYANDPVYRLKPVLHEPGPISTGYFLSSQGIPVRAGEKLRVTGFYDGAKPHPGVMAITHVYIATGPAKGPRCAPMPKDRRIFWTRKDGRKQAPNVTVPLNGIVNGQVREISRPPGALRSFGLAANVLVKDTGFAPANLSVARGARITYRWTGRDQHNIYIASGPRNVASGTRSRGYKYVRKFDAPGQYKLFCTLHPVTMQQVVDVRP